MGAAAPQRFDLFLLGLTVVPTRAYSFADRSELLSAANAWFLDGASTELTYGAMPTWDVSRVTSLKGLFQGRSFFNEDISSWNVGAVSDLDNTFYLAKSFNQDLGGWDMSQVASMKGTFYKAEVFNSPVNAWDVSKVSTMYDAFNGCKKFNQDISNWDVNRVHNVIQIFDDNWAMSECVYRRSKFRTL